MHDQKSDTKQSLSSPSQPGHDNARHNHHIALNQPERTLLTFLSRNETLGLKSAVELFRTEYSFEKDGSVIMGTSGSPCRKEWSDCAVALLARVGEVLPRDIDEIIPAWRMASYDQPFRAGIKEKSDKADKTETKETVAA